MVGADDPRGVCRSAGEADPEVRRVLDDVVVRHDVAAPVDDEARTPIWTFSEAGGVKNVAGPSPSGWPR